MKRPLPKVMRMYKSSEVARVEVAFYFGDRSATDQKKEPIK